MFIFAITALFVAMILVLIRLYAGPSVYDRVLAANSFGTHTVLFIGVLGFLNGRPDFLDVAMIYALTNFVGTIAVLKFFRYRSLGDSGLRETARKSARPAQPKPRKKSKQKKARS